jgi:hypothetical protein
MSGGSAMQASILHHQHKGLDWTPFPRPPREIPGSNAGFRHASPESREMEPFSERGMNQQFALRTTTKFTL